MLSQKVKIKQEERNYPSINIRKNLLTVGDRLKKGVICRDTILDWTKN